MSANLGVGVIGCGNISTAYFSLSRLFRGIEMRACADIVTEAAEAQAAEVRPARRNRRRPARGGRRRHHRQPDGSRGALRGVEEASSKPASMSIPKSPSCFRSMKGWRLSELAEKKGLSIGSAPDTFLGGAHQLARDIVDSGKVGRITSGTCFVMSHGMEHWHPNPDFFFQPGAGPMLDVGPYYVTDLIQLIGPVKRVAAFCSVPAPERTITSEPRRGQKITVNTPTTIHSILEFANKAVVTVNASWDVWAHGHAPIELYGEEGTLYVPDPNFFGGEVRSYRARRAGERGCRMAPSLPGAQPGAARRGAGQLPHGRAGRHGAGDRRGPAAPLLAGAGAARRRRHDRHPQGWRDRRRGGDAHDLRAAGRRSASRRPSPCWCVIARWPKPTEGRKHHRGTQMTWQPAENRYDTMTYNRCGRSGLKLPAISLGLWHNFGGDTPHETKVAICRRAFDLGITHFDLANNYGPPPGSAEAAFGKILQRRLRRPSRRADHLHQGRLRHVAGALWRVGQPQIPAGQPRPEPETDGSRLCRHLLFPPLRSRHAAGRNHDGARPRGALGQGALCRHFLLQFAAHARGRPPF